MANSPGCTLDSGHPVSLVVSQFTHAHLQIGRFRHEADILSLIDLCLTWLSIR